MATKKINRKKPDLANRPLPVVILKEQYMDPAGISINGLAKHLKISPGRLGHVMTGRYTITPELALRLERYFGDPAEKWLNLQIMHDLDVARKAVGKKISKEVKPMEPSG